MTTCGMSVRFGLMTCLAVASGMAGAMLPRTSVHAGSTHALPASAIPTSSTWTQTSAQPSERCYFAMAYDEATHQTVDFGGWPNGFSPAQSGGTQETWTYDGSSWTQHLQASGPSSSREWPQMAYDGVTHSALLYGGALVGHGALADTWSWNGSAWTQVMPANNPGVRYGGAMVYDPDSKTVLLFGGMNAEGLPDNTTWTWDGTAWTQQSAAVSPPPRELESLAYDPISHVVVMFGGDAIDDGFDNQVVPLGDTWTWDGTNWSPVAGAGPSPRTAAAMDFDAASGQILLFGGRTGAPGSGAAVDGDTWAFSGTGWTQLSPAQSPSARSDAQMVFETAEQRSFLVQGCPANAGSGSAEQQTAGPVGDSWNWMSGNWTAATPEVPESRIDGAGAYDGANNTFVYFGGLDTNKYQQDDTWEWDGTQWHLMHPAHSPPARGYASMAYVPRTKTVVLFGGANSPYPQCLACEPLSDTWSWDGADWTQQSPATSPSAREQAAMATDPATGEALLFSGCGVQACPGDTWEWDGSTWTQVASSGPSARYFADIAPDYVHSQVVLFGGDDPSSGAELTDTWTWDGDSWTTRAPAGSPSSSSAQVLSWDPTTRSDILFGPQTGKADGATWQWDGTTWNALAPTLSPAGYAYATGGGGPGLRPVLVGGFSRNGYDEATWTFNASTSGGGGGGGGGQLPSPAPVGSLFTTGTLPPAPASGLTGTNEDSEPGIAVDGGGVFWTASDIEPFAAHDPRALKAFSGSDVWKSTDSGRTWTWMAAPFNTVQSSKTGLGGEDSDIAVAPVKNSNGYYNIYVASLWIASTNLAISQDGGVTWTVIPINGEPVQDRPWLAADGACIVYLSYHAMVPYDTMVDKFDTCNAQDQAIGSAVDPTETALFAGNILPGETNRFGKQVVDNSAASPYHHRIYVPMEGCTDATIAGLLPEVGTSCQTAPEIFVGYSDDGTTYKDSPVAAVNTDKLFIWPDTIATDSAGNVYIAWFDDQNSYLSVSRDGGSSWSKPIQIDAAPALSSVYPTVAASSPGRVDVAFYGSTSPGDADSAGAMGAPNQYGSSAWQLFWTTSTDYGKTWTQSTVTPPIHTGVLCYEGGGCGQYPGDRNLLDDFGMAISPTTGMAVIAFSNDQPNGLNSTTHTDFAAEITLPANTPEIPYPAAAVLGFAALAVVGIRRRVWLGWPRRVWRRA